MGDTEQGGKTRGWQMARIYSPQATGQEPGSDEGKGKLGDGTGVSWLERNGKPAFTEGLLSLCQALLGL